MAGNRIKSGEESLFYAGLVFEFRRSPEMILGGHGMNRPVLEQRIGSPSYAVSRQQISYICGQITRIAGPVPESDVPDFG